MSFNAAVLRLMADKGLSALDIAEIAEAAEGSKDSAAERRRAWDRERKRVKREEERSSGGMSGGNPPDPSPNDIDNLTPTREGKTEAKASSKNGTRLPIEWEPSPLVGKTAEMVTTWPAGMIERELAKFKDHWLKTPGARGRSLDWDASYRNWLRNADERKPKTHERSNNPLGDAVSRILGEQRANH